MFYNFHTRYVSQVVLCIKIYKFTIITELKKIKYKLLKLFNNLVDGKTNS